MADGRVKNSMRNIFYRVFSQFANILLKFLSRTVFIYILGAEFLGINGLFSEVLQMLALADLGFGTAMVFSMYQPLAENNQEKIAQLMQLYKKLYRVIAIVITVIGVALIPCLPYIVNLDSEIPYLNVYYLLYLANTVSSYLVIYKTCILNADQKNYLISKYDTVFNFLSTIMCTIFLYITRNFMVYLLIQVLFTYLKNFYCSHIAEKMYPYINNKVDKLPQNESKKIFDNVKSVFIYKLSTTLVGSTDNTLISIMVGTRAVGLYSNYSMIISNVSMIINIIFSSVTASIGNLVVERKVQKNYDVYKKMQLISFILSTISISGIYVLINDFVRMWLGETYVLDGLIVIAIIVNMYFSIILMPIWSYREATGMYRQTKYVMVVTAIVNLFLSIILGEIMGLAGILLATSIARLSTYFWYEPKLLFAQFFEQSVWKYYREIGINIILTMFVIMIEKQIFSGFTPDSWIAFGAKAIIVATTTLILTVLLYSRNSELHNIVTAVKGILKRKGDSNAT